MLPRSRPTDYKSVMLYQTTSELRWEDSVNPQSKTDIFADLSVG